MTTDLAVETLESLQQKIEDLKDELEEALQDRDYYEEQSNDSEANYEALMGHYSFMREALQGIHKITTEVAPNYFRFSAEPSKLSDYYETLDLIHRAVKKAIEEEEYN